MTGLPPPYCLEAFGKTLHVRGAGTHPPVVIAIDGIGFPLDDDACRALADTLYSRIGLRRGAKTVFVPRPCRACGETMVRADSTPGLGVGHHAKGLCGSCYRAWVAAGHPPLETFRHIPRRQPLNPRRPLPPRPAPPSDDWRARAACAGMHHDLFFPGPGDSPAAERALKVCARCPVRRECLADADATEPIASRIWGVRGGETPRQRRRRRFGREEGQ